MSRTLLTGLVCLVVSIALPSMSLATDDEGFVSIFDGTSLDGWHKNPKPIGHGSGGHWTVEDGAIVGEQDPPGNGGILLTDKQYGDVELLIDMKPDWGVDSGLFVRGNDQGQCFQMMVDYHEAGNVGHLYGEGTGGFNNRPFEIFGEYDAAKKLTALTTKPNGFQSQGHSCTGAEWVKAWKINDWNTARVRVVGNPPQITTWINDVKVSEFDGATYQQDGYDRDSIARQLGDEGSIAVQVHGGKGAWPSGAKCRWKNIRIKPL